MVKKKNELYNKIVIIPLTTELVSRLYTAKTGKYDKRLVNINRFLYSLAEGVRYSKSSDNIMREILDIIRITIKSYRRKTKK